MNFDSCISIFLRRRQLVAKKLLTVQATWGVFDRDNMLRRALADSLTEAGHVYVFYFYLVFQILGLTYEAHVP